MTPSGRPIPRPRCVWNETGSTTISASCGIGRALRGARDPRPRPLRALADQHVLAAVRVTGLTAPGVFDGAMRWRDASAPTSHQIRWCRSLRSPATSSWPDNLGAHKVFGRPSATRPPGRRGGTLWYVATRQPGPSPAIAIELCGCAKLRRPSFAPLAGRRTETALAGPRRVLGALQP